MNKKLIKCDRLVKNLPLKFYLIFKSFSHSFHCRISLFMENTKQCNNNTYNNSASIIKRNIKNFWYYQIQKNWNKIRCVNINWEKQNIDTTHNCDVFKLFHNKLLSPFLQVRLLSIFYYYNIFELKSQ